MWAPARKRLLPLRFRFLAAGLVECYYWKNVRTDSVLNIMCSLPLIAVALSQRGAVHVDDRQHSVGVDPFQQAVCFSRGVR